MYEALLQEMTGIRLYHEEEAIINRKECVQLHDRIDEYAGEKEEKAVSKKKVCEIYFNSEIIHEPHPEQFLLAFEEKGKKKSFLLKRKHTVGEYGNESSVKISRKQYTDILTGSLDWMKESGKVLINEFYCKIKLFHYKISKIIKCYREDIYLKYQQLQISIDDNIKSFLIGELPAESHENSRKAYVRIRSTQVRRGNYSNQTLLEELLK